MSSIKIFHPKYRLTELLPSYGGKTIRDALFAAESNLDAIRGDIFAEVESGLASLRIKISLLSQHCESRDLEAAYRTANGVIGLAGTCGRPEIDEVLFGLCTLLDAFQIQGRSDEVAISLHLQALDLLLSPAATPEANKALLTGLAKVRRRMGKPLAESAPNSDE